MVKPLSMLLHLFFPNQCGFCGELVGYDKLLCDKCAEKTTFVSEDKLCDWSNPLFVSVFPFYYQGGVKRAVIDLKFHQKLSRVDKLGLLMSEALKKSNLFQSVDVVVPVPMHKSDLKKRGYNQAELLAKYISKQISRPLVNNSLVKTTRTHNQHELNKEERAVNLMGAFEVKHAQQIAKKTVLLIDDVLTTGATASGCASALKNAGVQDVILLVAARTKYYVFKK